MILLYVDDLIIAASKNSIHNLETSISEIFVDTKLTIQNLDYYLGIKIRTLHEGKLISLHQTEYVDSVYEKYSYLLSNVDSNATTPLTKEAVEYTKAQIDPDANQHLEEDMSDSHDTFPYRELVGSLLYFVRALVQTSLTQSDFWPEEYANLLKYTNEQVCIFWVISN